MSGGERSCGVLGGRLQQSEDPRRRGHPDCRHRRAQGHDGGVGVGVLQDALHQTCIVHLIRSSTAFVSHKDRKTVLKPIYQRVDVDAAQRALEAFEASAMGGRHPAMAEAWRR